MTLLKYSLAGVLCALTATAVIAHDDERYQDKVVKTFSANANTQLQIDNTNGKVGIEGWNKDEVQITATIYTKNEAGRERVEVLVAQNGDTIDIDTHFAKQSGWSNNNYAQVDYVIYVPKYIELDDVKLKNGSLAIKDVTGDINASLKNGNMTATGLAANTRVMSKNGSVKLSYADNLQALKNVNVDSKNGSITVYLPDSVNATINATSTNGSISNGFGLPVDKSRSNRKKLSGELGTGDANIKLLSKNGSIRIKSL